MITTAGRILCHSQEASKTQNKTPPANIAKKRATLIGHSLYTASRPPQIYIWEVFA